MATIPSPKRNSRPREAGLWTTLGLWDGQTGRKDGGKETLRSGGSALEQKPDSRGHPRLIEHGLGRPPEPHGGIAKVRSRGLAAHLDTRGGRRCNRF